MRFAKANLHNIIDMRKVMKREKQKKIISKKRIIPMISVAAFIFSANAQAMLAPNNETLNAQEIQIIIASTVADAMSDVKQHMQQEKQETLPKLNLQDERLVKTDESTKAFKLITE